VKVACAIFAPSKKNNLLINHFLFCFVLPVQTLLFQFLLLGPSPQHMGAGRYTEGLR